MEQFDRCSICPNVTSDDPLIWHERLPVLEELLGEIVHVQSLDDSSLNLVIVVQANRLSAGKGKHGAQLVVSFVRE